jgi:hypothetical protein
MVEFLVNSKKITFWRQNGRDVLSTPDYFECMGRGRNAWSKKAELGCALIQNTKEAPP